MTQHNNYHPCTSILIEALRNMEGGDKVLKEWDKQRQIVDKEWQAAKADSERQIVDLRADNKIYAECNKTLLSDNTELQAHNSELSASINVLREALKGNDFPYSANLDIYNSVRFTDAPYGTMIMESKIVKWLCRNRAKDYFDEMVKGK